MKTLEQYFKDQPLLPEDLAVPRDGEELTSAEQAFLRKYLGFGSPSSDQGPAIQTVNPEQVMSGPAPQAAVARRDAGTTDPRGTSLGSDPAELQKNLREQPELQLIGFRLADQDYALPIEVIQEVIRTVEATKLPSAPTFLSGVVNLRGRVTPLISLRNLLRLTPGEDQFIIVCRHGGLQVGLQIQAVSTMHRVKQERIDWAVESLLGVQNEMICGLIRSENKRLISILSLDHLVQSLVKS
ncbi:chemotaxis protein CheW [Desulfonatronum sp. SC1]|uniref:chemotaxis protein CheW n=1 Tax=Desulfonatronum sp. SC1 TaxID=2109626 RepID=UPI000D304E44|nr:chemotaxis protein CheW [Desulfonatronum sp. SC1]PTN38710.1 chemotaxis protein CheW [Desulfonatronum sp. SC1]